MRFKMSAPMEKSCLQTTMDDSMVCEVEATVVTGFEEIARDEAIEKFDVTVNVRRGMIFMHLPLKKIPKVLELGCIDNAYVVMTRVSDFEFTQDELECMRKLQQVVKIVDWEHGLAAWSQVFSFSYPIACRPDVIPDSFSEPIMSSRLYIKQKKLPKDKKKNKGKWRKSKGKGQGQEEENQVQDKETEECDTADKIDIAGDGNEQSNQEELTRVSGGDKPSGEKGDNSSETDKPEIPAPKKQRVEPKEIDPTKPSFRVTCYRNGDNHSFDSMGAAANFGGAVNDYFHWNVSMKNFDIEVVLDIEDREVKVCLALNKGSLHMRNITVFGPTTLRPTIAFNILRLCKIQPGDVICDPMCGSGSIPIQAAISWQNNVHLCGEIANKAVVRTAENIKALNSKRTEENKPAMQLDAFKWDVTNLPLRSESVDVFITDLPFGKRMGSKEDNWNLYPRCMMEMARASRPGTGRACLLTQDKKCINKVISMTAKYWKCRNMVGFNMGGLAACVYVLHRKNTVFDLIDSFVGMKHLYPSDERVKKPTASDTD